MSIVSTYQKKIVGKGDDASKKIARITAESLTNNSCIDLVIGGMNGVAVARIPKGYEAVTFSVAGDPKEKDPRKHIRSAFKKAREYCKELGIEPVAVADIIDSYTEDNEHLVSLAETLLEEANKIGVGVVNGECAILEDRVNPEVTSNIAVTMLAMRKQEHNLVMPIIFNGKITYVSVNPDERAIYMNSDGIGTKPEGYERRAEIDGDAFLALGLDDSLAMKVDDSIILGATPWAIFDHGETRGNIGFHHFFKHGRELERIVGAHYILSHEDVGERLLGFAQGNRAFNVGGSAVCFIDEERLKNPLLSKEGDVVIAINNPRTNPRSNGITALRKIAKKMYGDNWHHNPQARALLEYLSSPSTIFYPIFKELVDENLVSAVYHMSGGALKGKFARRLAKTRHYATLDNLFAQTPIQQQVIKADNVKPEEAYATWPNNIEGYATCKPEDAEKVIRRIEGRGYNAMVAGKVMKARGFKTGVTLTNIKGSDNNPIYYSGRK